MADELDILLEPLYSCQTVNIGEYPESPIEHVRHQARERGTETRPVFCEMLQLCKINGLDYYWHESARWIKYEETVEGGKQRWSKPHIPLLTLQSIFQLKNCFKRGICWLDVEVTSFPVLIDQMVRSWEEQNLVDPEESIGLRAILLCNKEHVGPKRRLKHSQLMNFQKRSVADGSSTPNSAGSNSDVDQAIDDEREPEADARVNVELSKKLPENAEAASLCVGYVDSISRPVCAFVRLREPRMFLMLSEVPRPLRFMFVLLVPEDHSEEEIDMIGRALGTLLTDDVFVNVAYSAADCNDLSYGIDEFLGSIIVVPPGKWRKDVRLEPSEAVANTVRETRRTATIPHKRSRLDFTAFEGLQHTGRFCGGLIDDIKRRGPLYLSDFVDSFANFDAFSQVLAAVLYMFFANLTNIITFGGMMEQMLEKEMGVMECIIAGFISGIVFALFSGQPLNILSATGPVLIFERLFYNFCKRQRWEFLPARFWLGTWTALFVFILVAVDASFLVAYITRFTEEAFATLIAVIFIVESFQLIVSLQSPTVLDYAVTNATNDTFADTFTTQCLCPLRNVGLTYWEKYSNTTCLIANSSSECMTCLPEGSSPVEGPETFLFAVLLFCGTFALAYGFQCFRTSRFFPSKVRNLLADFSVILSILIMTLISYASGLSYRKLEVPKTFTPTKTGRSWFVDPLHSIDWWVSLASAIPALLLTVLVVMDQQITAVIINRKDNKLKKGFGYHLDLLVVGVLIMICSALGLPFFVAATVLSIAHVQSLRMESKTSAPGEKPLFLGVREQRFTGAISHVLIGLSIFLTPIKQQVPLAVLLGIFLFMGVSCLMDQQLVKRVLLFFMPVKYQPDYTYLRLISLKRVHLFTAIQLGAFCILLAVKYTKPISMVFPILLIAVVGVRIWVNRIFSPRECAALDDPLPVFRHLKKGNEPALLAKRATRTSFVATNSALLRKKQKPKQKQANNNV